MDEQMFWIQLEWRICKEFASLPKRNPLHWRSCDGIEPISFDADHGIFEGEAWMFAQKPMEGEERWTFDLHLPPPPTPRESLPWPDLFPADATHGWLQMAPERKHLTIRLKYGQLSIPKTEPEEPN